jgi:DNA-binding transcriptional MerR regulator
VNHGFPIAIAASRAGLSQHVIRAWEKRYGAITPSRSGTKRRLYSDEEIERLRLLRRATQAGHSIGNIASLPTENLRILAAETSDTPRPKGTPDTADTMLAAAFDAVKALDSASLQRLLQTGLVTLGRGLLTQRVIVPLIQRIGDEWEAGTIRVVHEHCATTVIRTLLGTFVNSHSATANAPVLIATTPPGQLHELGALIAGATASDRGWNVVYLGPSLPPEEIAGAFTATKADALALSIIYPSDDIGLPGQLRSIRALLPNAPIITGGRSANAYSAVLSEINAVTCHDIPGIVHALEQIRANRLK